MPIVKVPAYSRSRKGAWIEISKICFAADLVGVAPVRERGLKLLLRLLMIFLLGVAPVRERGLKFFPHNLPLCSCLVAPVRERGLKLA